MRILVTGGLGVNGVVVVRQLIQHGLRPLVLDYRPDFSLIADQKDEFDFVQGDITNFETVSKVFKENPIDRVTHLAAYISPEMDSEAYRSFTINCQGTTNLLEAAKEAGVKRFVAASSRAVYGPTPENVGEPGYKPIDESYPVRPIRAYEMTKLASEMMGNLYKNLFGIEYAALRFAGIYGPGKQVRHGKMSLRSRLVEDPLAGKPVILEKGGDALDDMIYVEDAGRALVDATLADRLNHTAYNIASGQGRSLRQYADAAKKAIPGAVIEIGPGGNPLGFADHRAAIFDISRAGADFGYRERYTLEEGVKDYVARLKKMGA